MSADQTETVVPIEQGDIIEAKWGNVEFVMDKACSVKLQDLFQTNTTTNKFMFNASDDGVLDLSCLDEVRKENERFLPKNIFVRGYLQHALELKLNHDHYPTVVYGSPGVGKSVFSFLAAIAVASTGRYKAVLYMRKVGDAKEPSTSLFCMTKTDEQTVRIVACRNIDPIFIVPHLRKAIAYHFFDKDINKSSSPTENGIKVIVDGPRYEDKEERSLGSDLITSGGCPPPKQENLDEWRLPIKAWSLDELFLALKCLKKCNRGTTEKIFDTAGGSVRLALKCCPEEGKVAETKLDEEREWMKNVVEAQANDVVVHMAYYSSELSADTNSLDRLRSMIVTEVSGVEGAKKHFNTTLVLGSAYIARILWSKLSMDEVHGAMIFAKNTGNQSLFGWHFELFCHKLSELAIDQWRQQAERTAASAPGGGGSRAFRPSYIQATGTGIDGIEELNAVWLYWKPSIPNFANIDAAILLGERTLLCLQYTVRNEHSFNILSFLHGFVYNISDEVLDKIANIKVIFAVPGDVTFSTVRVPIEQKGLLESITNQESRFMVKYVKSKQPIAATIPESVVVSGTEGQADDMDTTEGEDSDVVPYDESLDGGWYSVDLSAMTDDVPPTNLVVEFETVAVDLNSGSSPFFDLPSHP